MSALLRSAGLARAVARGMRARAPVTALRSGGAVHGASVAGTRGMAGPPAFEADAGASAAAAAPRKVQVFLDPAAVEERIMLIVGSFDKPDKSKLTPEASWKELGLDSLDAVELVLAIEMEFKVMIPDMEADAIKSVKDATRFVSTHPFAEFPGWNRFLPDAGNRVPAS